MNDLVATKPRNSSFENMKKRNVYGSKLAVFLLRLKVRKPGE